MYDYELNVQITFENIKYNLGRITKDNKCERNHDSKNERVYLKYNSKVSTVHARNVCD